MATFPAPQPQDPTPIGAGYSQPWGHGDVLMEEAWRACLAEMAQVLGTDRRGAVALVEGMPIGLAADLACRVQPEAGVWGRWQRGRLLRRLDGRGELDGETIVALAAACELAVAGRVLFQGRRVWQLAPLASGALLA